MPPSRPPCAPMQAACASVVTRVRQNGSFCIRARASSSGSEAPASARQAPVRAAASRASPAAEKHRPAAASTAAPAASTPRRRLAGPARPSPKISPERRANRARHCVPPPSTPSRSSLSTTSRLFGFTPVNTAKRKPIYNCVAERSNGVEETERPSPRYSGIDLWSPADIVAAMLEGQFAAVAAVHAARGAIERAALAVADRLAGEGRLIYAGAGTSGRLAVQDGAELTPTFSWPTERLLLLIAGGEEALTRAVEGAEDRTEAAA